MSAVLIPTAMVDATMGWGMVPMWQVGGGVVIMHDGVVYTQDAATIYWLVGGGSEDELRTAIQDCRACMQHMTESST
jgi:hypothetical protein